MKPAVRFFILAAALLPVFAPSAQAKKEWTLRGERRYKPENRKVLKVAWSRALKTGKPSKRFYPETSQPVESEGVIYVGTQGGYFYAVDAAEGRVLWKFENGEPIASAAGVADGRVVFSDLEGRVTCLTTANGELAWRQEFDRELLAKPLIQGGKIYLVKGEQNVMALSLSDGQTLWNRSIKTFVRDITMRGHAGTVADGGKLYVGLADGQLYALGAADGKILWSKNLAVPLKTFKDIDADALIDGDSLYVGGYSNAFYRLNKATGATLWSTDIATGVKPVILGDTVVVGDTRGRVTALDKASGRQIWFNDLNKSILSEPVPFEGKLFVTTYDKAAYLLDPDNGDQIQKLSLSAGSLNAPVVAGGHVVVLTNDGKLMSLASRDGR